MMEVSKLISSMLPDDLEMVSDGDDCNHVFLRIREIKELPRHSKVPTEYQWLTDHIGESPSSYVFGVDDQTYTPNDDVIVVNVPVRQPLSVPIFIGETQVFKTVIIGHIGYWKNQLWGYASNIPALNCWPTATQQSMIHQDDVAVIETIKSPLWVMVSR